MAAGDSEILERLVRLEEGQEDLKDDVRAIRVQMEGPPRDESIRGRLHKIETSEATANAAKAALAAAEASRKQAQVMRQQASENRFTKREKVTGLLLGACLLVTPWLTPLIYHTH